MNSFDDELKHALHREEPGPDFTDRVMSRVAGLQKREKPREKTSRLRRFVESFQPSRLKWAQMKWAMAGAMAILLLIAGLGVHNRRENERRRLAEIAEGQRAKEQVLLAMRITSEKLNIAKKKVHDAAGHKGESK
ncbi:MAG TPA: hypothetical protein VI479_22955 [Blastocatellia bacterium]